MYRVKTTFLLPSLLLFLLSACSEREAIVAPIDGGVEVVFSANQSTVTRMEKEEEKNLPSILIFKKNKGYYSYLKNEGQANWQRSNEEGVYLNSILLPTGNYRFLLASGFSEKEEKDGKVLFSSENNTSTSETYDKNYFFSYSSSENKEKQLLPMLKTCDTDLFADANENGFEKNDKEYALAIENKIAVKRKITRLQARLDLLVRRAKKETNGNITPIPEGESNIDAMSNALKKIKNIQIQVDNVSSRCHVDGLRFSTPGSYSFSLIDGTEYDFKKFSFESFKSDFNGLDEDYRKFENSAYCKGALLFPAPNEGKVTVTVEINYNGILPKNTVKQDLLLERNKVSFLVIWLLNEEITVSVEVNKENLEYSDETKGDNGFWN